MTQIKFPECVYLGEFCSQRYGSLPAYLPATQGGFCLQYQTGEETQAHHLIENSVLSLLEEMPAGLLHIYIFDFANRPSFPFLAQLKQHQLYHIFLNEYACTQAFNELEQMIQTRYQVLFSASDSHLDHYNARSSRPEKYYVVIINTAYFPHSSISEQRMQKFIMDAYDVGIYIIALHNRQQFIENNQHALHTLIKTLPYVMMTQNFTWLYVDERTLPVQKMSNFDFQFKPADVNQTAIIEQLDGQFNKQTATNESDFLHIKIGELSNGDDAYLSLGQLSENYCAMLLGIPGSGKSTLMNNIIMQIGKHYHAGQIRLYLMDFAGVEFNQFKDHPNVEKIFLEANAQQQGLTLLESLRPDVEARRQLFKSQNVKDIDTYNAQNPDYTLPRIIIMIDEFHRLFGGDIYHRRDVNNILSDIVREWRKFGIYLFLCTQTLKGVDLNTELRDQIGLRISYRVNNESALGGASLFNSKYTSRILGLNKYEALFQTRLDHAFTAFIDEPHDIEQTIAQLRLTRPPHLQVKAQVFKNQATISEHVPPTPTPTQPEPTKETTAFIPSLDSIQASGQNHKQCSDLIDKIQQLKNALPNEEQTNTPPRQSSWRRSKNS